MMATPKLYLMTIYVDANGNLNFDSVATDGTNPCPHDPQVIMKPNDYLKWRIGGNLQDAHKPITDAELNLVQASPFQSGVSWWRWASGDNPVGCPECLPFDVKPGTYRSGTQQR
jgi:hypothetical protein